MILHIYHCNLAIFRDYKDAPGRNRPDGTGRFPERPGGADITYLPPTKRLGDERLGRFLELFQSIDLEDRANSPIRINWTHIDQELGLSRSEAQALLRRASRLGLMQRLTIDYDHAKWMHLSDEKGCLVVMTCVEADDLTRPKGECAKACADAIDAIKEAAVGDRHTLNRIAVVPNGHLSPRSGPGLPWQPVLALLKTVAPALERRGYDATLNSYGYTKQIQLAINAHKIGYVLRVV